MRRILFLAPRLDVTFKEGPVPFDRGPLQPIRVHWKRFIDRTVETLTACGDLVDVEERPLWQFNQKEISDYLSSHHYDYVYIPHKEYRNFPIDGHTKPLYYMQTQFPWIFSVDPLGWGSGAEYYPFQPTQLKESPAFESLYAYCHGGQSKFGQPARGTNTDKLPHKPYVFLPCQLPHDETIKYHSNISMEYALSATCLTTKSLGMSLVVKGHPVNPGSMEPLRQIAAAYDHVTWLDDLHIWDAVSQAQVVVTVNSGTGFEALLAGTPLCTFGHAEYDVVSTHVTPTTLYHTLQYGNYRMEKESVYGFFETWYNWCYDTFNAKSFSKLPA